MEITRLINKIKNDLLCIFPLFGNILASLEFKYTKQNVPAPAFTDGKAIYYKDSFLQDYTYEEQVFIIAHELFHVVLKHLKRNTGKDPDLLNYVEDAIINQMLVTAGLTMPEDCVNEPDALNYSVEELYYRFLPKLQSIKEWLHKHTFHITIKLSDNLEKIVDEYSDISDFSKLNDELKSTILEEVTEALACSAAGKTTSSAVLEKLDIGTAAPLLSWQELLESYITSEKSNVSSFFEIEPDGILRHDTDSGEEVSNTEIIIDTSGSVSETQLKMVLRECKNISSLGDIKVGFCDVEFYGWNDINNEDDINNLEVIGRGGTDFGIMSNNFSLSADNKIVMTDGFCDFPEDSDDIIWLVVNWYLPYECENANANIIFIDIRELEKHQKHFLRVRKQS